MIDIAAAIGAAAFVLAAAALYCAWNAKRHAVQAAHHIRLVAWYLDLEDPGGPDRPIYRQKVWP